MLKDKVLKIVSEIPRGQVLTYKKVAFLAGKPQAYRAVGNILNENYNPKIPCHRVVRSDGKVGGYNRGMKKKIWLLRREEFFLAHYDNSCKSLTRSLIITHNSKVLTQLPIK